MALIIPDMASIADDTAPFMLLRILLTFPDIASQIFAQILFVWFIPEETVFSTFRMPLLDTLDMSFHDAEFFDFIFS